MGKVSIPLQPPKHLSDEEKRNWRRERNFILCPVVVITTVNKEGTPNAAIKTGFMSVSSLRRVAFSCPPEHHTNRNILETREFVVNIPTEDIIREVYTASVITETPSPPNVNEIEEAGLTPIPSERVKPPRIKECTAHYECVLDWCKEDIIVGKIVAASADENLLKRKETGKMMFVAAGLPVTRYGVAGENKRFPKVSKKIRRVQSK